MSKLVIGCGYVGHRLARFWAKRRQKVFVTSRSPARANALKDEGFEALVLDVTKAEQIVLPEVETIVFAVGFDRSGDKSIEEVYVNGLRNVLSKSPSTVRQFIYLSSSGVYGHENGQWVDEASPCKPNRPGGQACLAAERLLQHHPSFGSRAIILRLAGIYGPQRLPQATKLRSGQPLQVAADSFLNLVHVEDVVQIIAAAEQQLTPPAILCVSDGQPVVRRDFYRYLAELLGTTEPIFKPPPPDSSQAIRARGSKRILNDRLTSTLKFEFRYPTYRDGLAALARDL